jgi:CRISPR-associated protein (TIGR03986 family)
MPALMTPYRFIPLSPFVFRPDWAHLVSHDHPFIDGVSGVLELTLTVKTPLCVGGQQQPASDHMPGQVMFYRTPNNQLAIPGSSIKGMLRNVLEIACFGSFNQVEDQKLGVRDIVKGQNFYSRAMNRSQVYTGWLRFEQGQWRLVPCDYARVYQGDLITAGFVKESEWCAKKQAKDRYQLLGGLKPVKFDIEPYKYDCKKLAVNLGNGNTEGVLVVTGQPGPAYNVGESSKKREFVFYNHKKDSAKVISSKVINGFMQIYAESPEWHYWAERLKSLELGVPVFFHKDDKNEVKSLGLSRMYKLPYANSIHDAINHTHAAHLSGESPDLAGLLFGRLDESTSSGQNNLRGRVMPGLLTAVNDLQTKMWGPAVLSGPKPTFYPSYIRQPHAGGDYVTLMDNNSEVAGWKRYPLHTEALLPDLSAEVLRNRKVQVNFETAPSDTAFTGKLRFHNLRLIELGALLWAIDFGQRGLHHALGLGKPFGFGQVKLEVKPELLQVNSPDFQSASQERVLQTARATFIDHMNKLWHTVSSTTTEWEQSLQVASLIATQQPEKFKGQELAYYENPNNFTTAKQMGARLTAILPEPELEVTNVSEGELELEEMQFLLERAVEDLNKTVEQNLIKLANKLAVDADYWEPELKLAAGQLGTVLIDLATKKGKENDRLGKAAKKLMRLQE